MMWFRRYYSIVALGSLLIPSCSAAAGFFIQSGSLTWYHPKLKKSSDVVSAEVPNNSNVYSILSRTNVIDPQTGKKCPAIGDNLLVGANTKHTAWFPFKKTKQKVLVVVMPQLGDFDSFEYAELLRHVMGDLKKANIALRIIGIGNAKTAHMFSLYTKIPLEHFRVDPTASVHSSLNLHRGPNWDVPSWIPQNLLGWFSRDVCGNDNTKIPPVAVAKAWLNYMAMCAGIAAPGTLSEIMRGYLGDKSAPERLWPGEKVRAGPITIKGTSDVTVGPIHYQSLWKNEQGYLRPAELATIRLRSMMEVLTKFDHYIPDQRLLDWRGATFLLDENSCENGKPLYEYHDRGVLTYSESMDRPLSFLSNFIGMERARNPMGSKDPEFQYD
jgi:hypothetical protein